jgi:hypothetical protein
VVLAGIICMPPPSTSASSRPARSKLSGLISFFSLQNTQGYI